MTGYTKLFSSIIASTIWNEDNDTRLVWITMLAMKNRQGVVEGSIPGLATLARVSVDACRIAIAKLMAPDPDSRTKVDEGRRIREVDDGWLVINHDKFRNLLSADERRDYFRIKKAESRQRRSTDVKEEFDNFDQSHMSTHTDPDPDPDPEAKPKEEKSAPAPVQSRGAFEPGALPRDHMKHALCGEAFRVCLKDWQYRELAQQLNQPDPAVVRETLVRFLAEVETSKQPVGAFRDMERRFTLWLDAQGAGPKAAAKPKRRGVAELLAEADRRKETR